MAKIIGFTESFDRKWITNIRLDCFRIGTIRELAFRSGPDCTCYEIIQDAPNWTIGYQSEIRFFLDDGSHVDFKNDLEGQVNYLKDYIQNGNDTAPKVNTIITEDEDFIV